MSDEKKTDEVSVDDELNALLDNALADFDAPLKSSTKKDEKPQAPTASSSAGSDDEDWLGGYAKLLGDQLKTFVDGDIMQTSTKKLMDALNAGSSEVSVDDPSFQMAILETIKDVGAALENLQDRPSGDEMNDLLKEVFDNNSFSDLGETENIFPFMRGMMFAMLSKDMMYSLKELANKYPAYLEENKAKLSPTEIENYRKQQSILEKICEEQRKTNDDDSQEEKQQSFNKILNLFRDMEQCGRPPAELIGEQGNEPFFK